MLKLNKVKMLTDCNMVIKKREILIIEQCILWFSETGQNQDKLNSPVNQPLKPA